MRSERLCMQNRPPDLHLQCYRIRMNLAGADTLTHLWQRTAVAQITWRRDDASHRAHGHNAAWRMSQKQRECCACEINGCNGVNREQCMHHIWYGFLGQCTLACACSAGMTSARVVQCEASAG